MTRVFKCKGCRTYENDEDIDVDGPAVCNHVSFVKDHYCPCQSCVVKSMCIDACETYIEYIEWLIENHKDMLDKDKVYTFRRWISNVR